MQAEYHSKKWKVGRVGGTIGVEYVIVMGVKVIESGDILSLFYTRGT